MTLALLAVRNRRRILSLLAGLLAASALAVLVVTLAAGAAVSAVSGQQARTGNAALTGCLTTGTGDALAGMTTEQQNNAATIVVTTQARGLPQRAAVIALATAYQETKFVNYLTHTDSTTSLGLFAQMTVYYGYDVATNPAKATGAFLDKLTAQPNWETRPLTEVAADVQRPYEPYRSLYAQWEPLATKITGQLWKSASSPCAASVGAASSTPGPGGLTLTGSEKGNAAATFAMAQIGEAYLWGATGPDRWDCSGLMLGAWSSVGVSLTRVTYTQANEGTPVTQADARSGDLVLIAGSDGTTANPGHVGMVAGRGADGQTWLVEAPRTGLNVRLTPMSGWAGQIVTIRRIG